MSNVNKPICKERAKNNFYDFKATQRDDIIQT